MLSVFPSAGGQSAVAPALVKIFPPHRIYLEPFAGGASCFFEKPRSPLEILSDRDPDVIMVYRFLQEATPKELELLGSAPWELDDVGFQASLSPSDDLLQKVYQFLYRRYGSLGAAEETFDVRTSGTCPVIAPYLGIWQERLSGVKILCEDGVSLISGWDDPNLFIFLNPPPSNYIRKWQSYFDDERRKLLCEYLTKFSRTKWLWADSPSCVDDYGLRRYGWWVNEVEFCYQGISYYQEVISNYPLPN